MNILLIKVSSLGDVLHNMPIVNDLLRHTPDANIDWVVEEAFVDLVRLHPRVRRIIPFALRRWRKQLTQAATWSEMRAFKQQLQEASYDLVFDTQGLMKTGILMGLSNATPSGIKAGLANGTEGSGYEAASRIFHDRSIAVPQRCHAVERCRRVVAETCDYALDSAPDFGLRAPSLQAEWMPKEAFAVFFHGTARAEKKWKQANWVSVAHALAKRPLQVLLPWGNQTELAEANALAEQIPNARVLPRLSMMEAVLLAQSAHLVVGVDTGLTHIAAAYCRPTVELYCDSPRWKTEGNWSDRIVNLGDLRQAPEVAEVLHAIDNLLGT